MIDGVRLILFLSGPLVLIAYVASSAVRSAVARRADDSSPRLVVEVAATLSAAAIAWVVIRYLAPGQTTFRNASAVGFLSTQVLTAWSSLALWSGAAAVAGQAAPVTERFRAGSAGLAGAFALLVVFLPVTALAGLGAWAASSTILRSVRPALAATYAAVPAAEWVLVVVDPAVPYGLGHGPETLLFVTAVAGGLTFRWAVGDGGTS